MSPRYMDALVKDGFVVLGVVHSTAGSRFCMSCASRSTMSSSTSSLRIAWASPSRESATAVKAVLRRRQPERGGKGCRNAEQPDRDLSGG